MGMGLLMGLKLSHSLKMRERSLKTYDAFLDEISTKIRYQGTTLENLIAEAISSQNYIELPFLNEVLLDLQMQIPFEKSWDKAVSVCENFSQTDKELVKMLSNYLGKSDIDGQISAISLQKALVQKSICEASEDCCKKGKMYRSVCTLIGAGLGIMLI